MTKYLWQSKTFSLAGSIYICDIVMDNAIDKKKLVCTYNTDLMYDILS